VTEEVEILIAELLSNTLLFSFFDRRSGGLCKKVPEFNESSAQRIKRFSKLIVPVTLSKGCSSIAIISKAELIATFE